MSMQAPVIAVDFGGTSIKMGVTLGAEILLMAEPLPTPSFDSPEAIMRAIAQTARQLMQAYPDVCAMGMGMPGWCDFHQGILYQLTNVPVWNHQVPVKDVMEKELGIPVVIDNDANAMAYAEWKLGAGKGMESLVCLTLGTGIGGGIVIHNQMLRGKRISAAELGQTSIHYAGRPGPFGNRGAIEEYIGNNEFAQEAVDCYRREGRVVGVEDCTPYALELAAKAGDPVAMALWQDFADKLACLIMNYQYALVPEAFIIGGGVSKAGDLLFKPLYAALKEQLFPLHYEDLRILPAAFGSHAGLIGAGAMARDFVASCKL